MGTAAGTIISGPASASGKAQAAQDQQLAAQPLEPGNSPQVQAYDEDVLSAKEAVGEPSANGSSAAQVMNDLNAYAGFSTPTAASNYLSWYEVDAPVNDVAPGLVPAAVWMQTTPAGLQNFEEYSPLALVALSLVCAFSCSAEMTAEEQAFGKLLPGANSELIASSQAYDPDAQALAQRIGGQAQAEFASGPNAGREFDAISDEYVAQSKPANFTGGSSWRGQARATFQAAIDSGRTPYFQFNGPPSQGVLNALQRYAQEYGVQPVIDTEPLGGN